jgi:hypothetical protein
MKDQLGLDLEATGKSTKTEKISLNEQCIWEGIGMIQFPDGSTYQGMTKNA